MASLEEMEDISLGSDAWEGLDIQNGDVIEVYMPSTDWVDAPDVWAGFLVRQVSVEVGTQALVLVVKSLGSENGDLAKAMGSLLDRREGTIHLCTSRPCATSNVYELHATKIRTYKLEDFNPPYITRSTRSQIKKWLEKKPGDEEEDGKKWAPRMRLRGKSRDGDGKGRPSALKSRAKSRANPGGKPQPGAKKGRGEGLQEAAVGDLKAKLASLRARLSGSGKSDPKATEVEPEGGIFEVESSEGDGYEPSPDGLSTGTEIIPFYERGLRERKKKKVKKMALPAADSKGTTMRGLQGQLANRAVAATGDRRDKKKGKKSSAEKVGEAIVKALGVGKVKKEKKDKKRKKKERRRKRKRGGGDPESSGTSDSSGGSYGSSSEDHESGSSEEYENPMRKKSKDRPGAVLELLVQHAREQLEQSSTVTMPQGKIRIDEGVKILSYFQILLRPQLGAVTGPVREMFLIASVLDQLRSGNLSAVGDGLAARFFALHQSILDGGWSAARHLEIYSMEETSATTTAMLLQTRRHAKLAAKALGLDQGNNSWWKGAGRGRGGKGSKGYKGGETEAKGKKGGKSNKGKGRGGWYNDKAWGSQDGKGEKGAQDWANAKEQGKDA